MGFGGGQQGWHTPGPAKAPPTLGGHHCSGGRARGLSHLILSLWGLGQSQSGSGLPAPAATRAHGEELRWEKWGRGTPSEKAYLAWAPRASMSSTGAWRKGRADKGTFMEMNVMARRNLFAREPRKKELCKVAKTSQLVKGKKRKVDTWKETRKVYDSSKRHRWNDNGRRNNARGKRAQPCSAKGGFRRPG